MVKRKLTENPRIVGSSQHFRTPERGADAFDRCGHRHYLITANVDRKAIRAGSGRPISIRPQMRRRRGFISPVGALT